MATADQHDAEQRILTKYREFLSGLGHLHRPMTEEDWTQPCLLFHSINHPLSAKRVASEYLAAKSNALKPDYKPEGPAMVCYRNVKSKVERDGGRPVFGWQVTPSSLSRANGFGIELEAHAVWESPNGALVEVTEASDHWLFAPSSFIQDVEKGCRAAIVSMPSELLPRYKSIYENERVYVHAIRNPLARE